MMRLRRGYGETWAKTILMGEHSVVYGFPAVAVPIRSLKMRAWAVPSKPGRPQMLRALGYYGPLDQAPASFGGVQKAVEEAKAFAGAGQYGFDIVTRSDFPAGRGLGSSAAASGAVVRAILDSCGATASSEELVRLTNRAEVITHGHPSGLDAVTTCGDDPVLFAKGAMTALAVCMPAYLVIADSGVAGSTKEAVDDVRGQYDRHHAEVQSILEGLGELAADAARDLQEGGLNSLGRRMNRAHALLDALNISHPIANDLVVQARRSGALGAKMTGGGLGGCIIALAADDLSAHRIRRDLLASGAPAVGNHPLNQVDVEDGGALDRDMETKADPDITGDRGDASNGHR